MFRSTWATTITLSKGNREKSSIRAAFFATKKFIETPFHLRDLHGYFSFK